MKAPSRWFLVFLLVMLPAISLVQAQGWPSKPIRIIVPQPPGGPMDTMARGFIEPLFKSFGQPVIVENRVGADSIIGTEACIKAGPDGHTLCSTASKRGGGL